VAEETGCQPGLFRGGTLCAPHEFDSQRNVAYDLASPERAGWLTGHVGSIGQFVGPEQLKEFYAHFQPCQWSALHGGGWYSECLTDSLIGVKDSINHLIEVHHFRQIAFLRGPETNPEAEQRYETYVKTLAEHAIPLSPSW